MSPEETLAPATILGESSRIANAILVAEERVNAFTRAERERELSDIRGVLGYTAVSHVEAADLVDARITQKVPVITPEDLNDVLPLTEASAETTRKSRQAIEDILSHKDDRLLVIVGPCSIHDPQAALEYAENVRQWREAYGDDLEIVMRFYPEKPRTERGWKGFIYDPGLNNSDDINQGIVATRMMALQITANGVPLAMERLNALTPQYVNGLVAYDAIGARNTTDQKAREYASGTSSPVGFKNTPEGSTKAAVQAVVAALGSHSFLGMGMVGTPHQIETAGNPFGHVILRGNENGPNYHPSVIANLKQTLVNRNLLPSIVVDVSHGNSQSVADRQVDVVIDIGDQVAGAQDAICGVMIESNLEHGRQKIGNGENLKYGQSVTDECIGLDQTEACLDILAQAAQIRREALAT